MSPTSPTVLVGVSGGIAAYKTLDVVSALRKEGADVHVAMTDAAMEFVRPLAFSALTGNRVISSLFHQEAGPDRDEIYPHLYPATETDVFLLAPATANQIAKAAEGKGEDLLSTCILSLPAHCRKYYCPAMNVEMWENEAVQTNSLLLEERGWIRIGPESGPLACGTDGFGRMAPPSEITDALVKSLQAARALEGRRILILSGPTREHLDPVRFIGNPSSGRMGKALAEEAAAMGAIVEFVTGPVAYEQRPRSPRIRVHDVRSAQDMLDTAKICYPESDISIFAAAVADYTPEAFNDVKQPKQAKGCSIRLKPTPDIASTLNAEKPEGHLSIGFALQSHNGFHEANEKLVKKQFDAIVLNHLDALGTDTGTYDFRSLGMEAGKFLHWGTLSKRACARRILCECVGITAAASKPKATSTP